MTLSDQLALLKTDKSIKTAIIRDHYALWDKICRQFSTYGTDITVGYVWEALDYMDDYDPSKGKPSTYIAKVIRLLLYRESKNRKWVGCVAVPRKNNTYTSCEFNVDIHEDAYI